MEQLTPKEWAQEQVRRAPAFAIATGVITLFLIVSAFIEYSPAMPRPELAPVIAELADIEDPVIEEIKHRIDPDVPELKPVEDAPIVEDEDVSTVDAPLEETTLDIDFTEDLTSDVTEPTDPFPMDLAKKMAVIGTGPGTGGFRGALGSRSRGGRRRAAKKFGMPKKTTQAILDALRWLKKTQNKQTGGWDITKLEGSNPGYARGTSALALLAFLGFGCTDKTPEEFAPTVKRAINYLLASQKNAGGGSFGEDMYSQGICTMALCEAYGMMGGRDLRDAAQAGLHVIFGLQVEGGGFGYLGPPDWKHVPQQLQQGAPRPDTSITGFQIQAIKAGITSKLDVPEDAKRKTENFLQMCVNPDGSSWYRSGLGVPDWNTRPRVLSLTAASLTGRLFMGHKNTDNDCLGQANYLKANGHLQMAASVNNYYGIYYLSLAMFNMGGEWWDDWNRAFNPALRAKQVKSGPNKGSWPVKGSTWGGVGGRVYTTAMACLSLEVYFRYLPTYKTF